MTGGGLVDQEAGTDTNRILPVAEAILRAESHRHDQLDLLHEALPPTSIPTSRNGAGCPHPPDSVKEGLPHHVREVLHHRSVEGHRLPHVAFHRDQIHHHHVTTPQYLLGEAEVEKIHQSGESPGPGHLQLLVTRIATLWMGPLRFVGIMAIQTICLVGGETGHTTTIVETSEAPQ